MTKRLLILSHYIVCLWTDVPVLSRETFPLRIPPGLLFLWRYVCSLLSHQGRFFCRLCFWDLISFEPHGLSMSLLSLLLWTLLLLLFLSLILWWYENVIGPLSVTTEPVHSVIISLLSTTYTKSSFQLYRATTPVLHFLLVHTINLKPTNKTKEVT